MNEYLFVSKCMYNDNITIYYNEQKLTFTGYTVKQAIQRARKVFKLNRKHITIIGAKA